MDGDRNAGWWRGNCCPGCVGICNDGFGKLWSFVLVESTEFPQELFTCEDPFHPISSTAAIVRKILKGPPDRPSAENTCSRLSDEWWGICSEYWHFDPSKHPTMLQVAEKIKQIVCSSLIPWLPITDGCHFFIPLLQAVQWTPVV